MSWPAAICALSGSILLAGWVAYPFGLALAGGLRRLARNGGPQPAATDHHVSVIIATRDEPAVVARRIADLLANGYARELLQIVVGVDCRARFALAEYQAALGGQCLLVTGDEPGGKAATLNAAVRAASAELLLFADSQQSFVPGAVGALSASLHSPEVGAVTGTWQAGKAARQRGVLSLFWNYELALRRRESALHSVVAVTGAIYAMRRSLWQPLPPGLICDDLQVPFYVVRQGYRVVASEAAIAIDDRRFTRRQDYARKVRTLTGLLQFCSLNAWVLVPWRNPIWVQFLCHKLIRLATPYLLIALLLGALPLLWPLRVTLPGWPWQLLGVTAIALAVTLMVPRTRRIVGQAAWAGWLLTAPVLACRNAIRRDWDVWR